MYILYFFYAFWGEAFSAVGFFYIYIYLIDIHTHFRLGHNEEHVNPILHELEEP